jgi:PadR family transcriptional regulator PadR
MENTTNPPISPIAAALGAGLTRLVVLAAVARANEPIHGYELARKLSAESPEGMSFKQGTLYPLLRTMEREGLISSVLIPSSEGPARKCFSVTPNGTTTLQQWTTSWQETALWVSGILEKDNT